MTTKPGILWLASYPKSGNTWLRAFLANLFTGAAEPFDINKLSDFTYSDMRAGYFEAVARQPISNLDADEINRLRPRVHKYLAEQSPDTVFVKTHHAIGDVNGIDTITSDLTEGAIYVVRNPFDVVVSFAKHMAVDFDTAIEALNDRNNYSATHGRLVFQYLSSWSEHVKSWTRAPGLTRHVMRYEHMLEDPKTAFGALGPFFGVEIAPERLETSIRFSSFGELKAQEEAKGFRERSAVTESFFRQGQQGGWRDLLNAAQIERIVEAHGEIMEEFGYLP